MVISTKLFILVFCYEILKLIRKHRISHKTHEWFYRYWGAQLLILSTLIFVTYFDTLKQKNKPALLFFYVSLGLDGLCCIFIFILWLPICAIISCVRRYQFKKLINGDSAWGPMTRPLVTPPWEIAALLPEETSATIKILGIRFPHALDVIIGEHTQQCHITIPKKKMAQLTDITEIKLPAGTDINLPSETMIKLNSNTTGLSLNTYDPSDNSTNTFNNLEEDTEIILSNMTETKLVSETTITFSSIEATMELMNNTSITLPKKTQINLPQGKFVYVSEDKRISLPECTATFTIPTVAKRILDESVPPPLTLMCECCSCGAGWKICWTVFTNVVSLTLFLAFSSYLSQALPAITISYYLNPTASLIRLGFYEVIIVVMLLEISYLLFLLDKCTWLCYFSKYQEIPDEIKVKVVDGEDHAQETDERKSYICQYIHDGELIGCKEICGCDCTYKCIHWLHITTFLQIIIMVFIIGLSIALLYFLLNVVIQQTSSPNDQFKDILAIVPTIALNLWLLSRQVDIGKALKDIVHKAHEYSHHHSQSQSHHLPN